MSNISPPMQSLIPNLILRTWKTGDRSRIEQDSREKRDHPDRAKWLKSWDDMNPGATQIIFNDDDMDKLVRGSFSQRVVDAYFKLPRIVLRSDFARYMMLYEIGGFYSDMDTSCRVPVYQWNLGFQEVTVIIGVENPDESRDSYLQWTMAAAPHHPLLADIIYRVAEKIHETDENLLRNDDGAVLDVTGPGIWKQVIWEYFEREGVDFAKISNLWDGYQLIGDILILGKSYLNNDNSDNPKSLIRHHFTGNSEFGWRMHGKSKISNQNLSTAGPPLDFVYFPPVGSIVLKNVHVSSVEIPKRVIQVANSSDPNQIPEEFEEWRDEWILLNPEYEFILMSNADVDAFVQQKCKDDEKQAFFKLPLIRQRVELFRYLWLMYEGGIYTEIDTKAKVPISEWVDKETRGSGPGFVRTTIASITNHEVIAKYVSDRVKAILAQPEPNLVSMSFFDMFESSFNQFIKTTLSEIGFDVKQDFRRMAWTGYAAANDVYILGQERMNPSSGRSSLSYVQHRGDLYNKEKGIWTEESTVSN
ncbi:membrane-bound alpha-1,6- mannosyltransferase Initiation-specific [Physocladia obscura]|uniref:Membrane-bound alpha-1,6- mannosyltransferase Initiation-specific n=1 Tax=Physocladia obscura TaxID=109957 RepID=A0AAD5TA55_9FUNG|nr:membrane-bound alpha-1,6- mannosyltransferase Initiation-specific [Physocladia obscura]